MSELTLKVQDKVVEEFLPIAEQLKREGKTDEEIKLFFKGEIKRRNAAFYSKKNEGPELFKDIFRVNDIKKKADSRTELIFARMLDKHGIKYKFQYPVGRYTLDFLVSEVIAVEIDGPQHEKTHDEIRDKYLRKMGYKIFRVPIFILTADPTAVFEELKLLAAKIGINIF